MINQKSKKNRTKKNKIGENKIGGDISNHETFSKILSIGYEFECGNMFALSSTTKSYEKTTEFIIPSARETEELIHDEECAEISDYNCLISYETDAPHATNTTPSLLSVYETILDEDPDKMLELQIKCKILQGMIRNLFITHTELLFTFFNRAAGCYGNKYDKTLRYPINKPNCIEETFLLMLDKLEHTFVFSHEVVHEDMKIIFFTVPTIEKPIFYGIPTTPDKNLTPQDIIWIPQMTYSVEPQNIMEVTERLSIYLNEEERNIIQQCIENSNSIFKDYKKWAKKVGTDEENPLVEIFKNILFFMLYYTHVYFFYEGTEKLNKNMFCFIFRHSVVQIYNYYRKPEYLSYLLSLIEYIRTQIVQTRSSRKVAETVEITETKWKSFICSSFVKIEHTEVPIPEEYTHIPMSSLLDQYFERESNYYEFTGYYVLTEFRCFHKNIIQTYVGSNRGENHVDTYKTLNEWRQIIREREPEPEPEPELRGRTTATRRARSKSRTKSKSRAGSSKNA